MRSFPPSLHNERVRLRPWRPADIDAFARAWQDTDLTYRFPVAVPFTQADATAWITQMRARWQQRAQAAFAIVDPRHGSLLGGCDLDDIDDPPATADIGYWLAAEWRGQGLATSAARLLVDWAFAGLALEHLTLHAEADNGPSLAVARRLGFSFEQEVPAHDTARGRFRDMLRFGLTAERFEARRSGP